MTTLIDTHILIWLLSDSSKLSDTAKAELKMWKENMCKYCFPLIPELDLVMEQDGKLIGQNMFMKAIIEADDGRVIDVLAMGPIGIIPELKRKFILCQVPEHMPGSFNSPGRI